MSERDERGGPSQSDAHTAPTHEPDRQSQPDRADVGEHEWVRRLLARAPEETVPAEVSTRLEARLADLVQQRDDSATATERALESRHERTGRRLVRGLLAAAAVLVLLGGGAFMTTHLPTPSGFGSGAGGSSADSAASGEQAAPTPSRSTEGRDSAATAVADLDSADFAAQATALLRGLDGGTALSQRSLGAQADRAPTRTGCSPTAAPDVERSLDIRLDGRPALLRVSPASGGRSRVEAVSCAGVPLASAVVRVP